MKNILIIATGLAILVTSTAYAAAKPQPVQPVGPYPRLNDVKYTIAAEQWVTTNTAKVIMSIDANLDQAGLDKLQTQVLEHLNAMAKDANWRLTQFNRSQDQSGLEKVQIQAQARLPEQELANIRAQAKKISKPGMKYSVASIDYSPSLGDVEKVRDQLRSDIYTRVKNEIALLEKNYPEQDYFVHSIDFDPMARPAPMARGYAQTKFMQETAVNSAGSQSMAVSQKIVLTANVDIAAAVD